MSCIYLFSFFLCLFSILGIFVAPVRGIYYFNFCYHASQQNRAALSLHKNDQLIASTSHHIMEDKLEPVNGSNGVALKLEVDDHVYVILDKDTWVWDGSYHDTVFTGFLVTRLWFVQTALNCIWNTFMYLQTVRQKVNIWE